MLIRACVNREKRIAERGWQAPRTRSNSSRLDSNDYIDEDRCFSECILRLDALREKGKAAVRALPFAVSLCNVSAVRFFLGIKFPGCQPLVARHFQAYFSQTRLPERLPFPWFSRTEKRAVISIFHRLSAEIRRGFSARRDILVSNR